MKFVAYFKSRLIKAKLFTKHARMFVFKSDEGHEIQHILANISA